jgi:hypothetical protein
VNVSTGFCVPSFIVRLAAAKAHWAKQAETSLLPTWGKARRRRVSSKGHDPEFAAACIFVIVGALAQTAGAQSADPSSCIPGLSVSLLNVRGGLFARQQFSVEILWKGIFFQSGQIELLRDGPRVNQHLETARRRAATGVSYVLQLPLDMNDPAHDWHPDLVKYWRKFGSEVGVNVPALRPPRGAEAVQGACRSARRVPRRVIEGRNTAKNPVNPEDFMESSDPVPQPRTARFAARRPRGQHPGRYRQRFRHQTANLVLLRSIFQIGVPVSGEDMFPSKIAGLPTWYTVRANGNGYIGRKKEVGFLVAAMEFATARSRYDAGL